MAIINADHGVIKRRYGVESVSDLYEKVQRVVNKGIAEREQRGKPGERVLEESQVEGKREEREDSPEEKLGKLERAVREWEYGSMGVWEYGRPGFTSPTLPHSHTPILPH